MLLNLGEDILFVSLEQGGHFGSLKFEKRLCSQKIELIIWPHHSIAYGYWTPLVAKSIVFSLVKFQVLNQKFLLTHGLVWISRDWKWSWREDIIVVGVSEIGAYLFELILLNCAKFLVFFSTKFSTIFILYHFGLLNFRLANRCRWLVRNWSKWIDWFVLELSNCKMYIIIL